MCVGSPSTGSAAVAEAWAAQRRRSSKTIWAAPSVTLTCGAGNLITGGASGSNVSSLSPTYTGPLPSGTCTLTVRATGISDADAIDPPDQLGADATATFSFGAIANDDSVNVTPHLIVSTAGGAINLTSNDILGSGQITGFGEPLQMRQSGVPVAQVRGHQRQPPGQARVVSQRRDLVR